MREGWEVKSISEVVKIISGGTPKTKIEEYWGGDIAWITPADLGKLISREVKDTRRTITQYGLEKSSAKLFPTNSVILSTRAPIGYLAINLVPMSTNQGCRGLVPSDDINSVFLYYFLKNNITLLNELGTGTTFKELSTKALGNISIPIPPLPEQTQIVHTLDKAFAQIDQAKANLEKNLLNAKELFQSKLNEVFSQRGEGWVEKTLESICSKIFAGGDAPKENFSKVETDEYPIPIYANAVKHRGLYGYTNIARVEEPSISISARGSGTGHTELRLHPYFPIVRLIVLIPNSELIELRFLKYIVDTLDILRSGSAIPQLTVPMIKQYKVYIPNLSEQKDLIEELDNLVTQTTKLQTHYQHKLNNLEELKKSILQKAFAGELGYGL